MKYAIISDLHANYQATKAVLTDIQASKIDTILCLGDVVGYGPDPAKTLELAYSRVHHFILGNHDAVIAKRLSAEIFNDNAKKMIEWTANKLDSKAITFFENVPLTMNGSNFRCSHSDFVNPGRFGYIFEPEDAMASFNAVSEPLLFIGHSHVPGIFSYHVGGSKSPKWHAASDFEMEEGYRYIVNVGSVGQPRDKDLRACYCIYDDEKKLVQFRRVPFDLDNFRDSLKRENLPESSSYFLSLDKEDGKMPVRDLIDFRPVSESEAVSGEHFQSKIAANTSRRLVLGCLLIFTLIAFVLVIQQIVKSPTAPQLPNSDMDPHNQPQELLDDSQIIDQVPIPPGESAQKTTQPTESEKPIKNPKDLPSSSTEPENPIKNLKDLPSSSTISEKPIKEALDFTAIAQKSSLENTSAQYEILFSPTSTKPISQENPLDYWTCVFSDKQSQNILVKEKDAKTYLVYDTYKDAKIQIDSVPLVLSSTNGCVNVDFERLSGNGEIQCSILWKNSENNQVTSLKTQNITTDQPNKTPILMEYSVPDYKKGHLIVRIESTQKANFKINKVFVQQQVVPPPSVVINEEKNKPQLSVQEKLGLKLVDNKPEKPFIKSKLSSFPDSIKVNNKTFIDLLLPEFTNSKMNVLYYKDSLNCWSLILKNQKDQEFILGNESGKMTHVEIKSNTLEPIEFISAEIPVNPEWAELRVVLNYKAVSIIERNTFKLSVFFKDEQGKLFFYKDDEISKNVSFATLENPHWRGRGEISIPVADLPPGYTIITKIYSEVKGNFKFRFKLDITNK